MPIPTEIAPIIAVTKFRANPEIYIIPYSHATTRIMGITVITAYLIDRIVNVKRMAAAINAIGNDE